MSISVDFHGDDFVATSTNFESSTDPFCTVDVRAGGNGVCFYIRTKDAARKLMDAASKAYAFAAAIEAEKAATEALAAARLAEIAAEEAEAASRFDSDDAAIRINGCDCRICQQ